MPASRYLLGWCPCPSLPRPVPPPGFGAATVLPMALTSFYVGAALVGVLFPLWIMMACDSNPRLVYQRGAERKRRGGGRGLGHELVRLG